MDRDNHYEAAFEAYLRANHVGYIAVDETRRSELDAESVKSLDFLVMGPGGSRLLVDIKGRRFPGGARGKPRKVWESWCMREDVEGLLRWTERFGTNTTGLLVFVYHLLPSITLPDDTPDLWCWRGRRYLLRAVEVGEYQRRMRVRSPKWDTVFLGTDDFRAVVQPFSAFALLSSPVPCSTELL